MCLLIVIRQEDGSLTLAANRDERYDRPARGPTIWPTDPPVLAGRDERAGGTWLAVNARGVLAAVTNLQGTEPSEPGRPSRGRLPLLACGHASAGQARLAVEAELKDARYNAFTLLVADHREGWVWQGSAGGWLAVEPDLHVVGNQTWNDLADPRVARVHHLLTDWRDLLTSPELLRDRLACICADHEMLPSGGTLCLHGLEGGTVSSTMLRLDGTGRLTEYLHAAGPPCKAPYVSLLPAENWGTS